MNKVTEVRFKRFKHGCVGPRHGQRGVVIGKGHIHNMLLTQFDDGEVWFCFPGELEEVRRPRVHHEPDFERVRIIMRQRGNPKSEWMLFEMVSEEGKVT